LLHHNITERGVDPDLLLKQGDKTKWIDVKSYSIMRPFQTQTINVNQMKSMELHKFGCHDLIFCFARPWSKKVYFSGLVPMASMSRKNGWKLVERPQSFNNHYSIKPERFLKYGAEIVRDLYYENQYSVDQVEELSFNTPDFDEALKRKYPKMKW